MLSYLFAIVQVCLASLAKEDRVLIDKKVSAVFDQCPLHTVTMEGLNSALFKNESAITSLHPSLFRIRVMDGEVYYFNELFRPIDFKSDLDVEEAVRANEIVHLLRLLKKLASMAPELRVDFLYYGGAGPNENIESRVPILAGNYVEGVTCSIIPFSDRLTYVNHSQSKFLQISDYSWEYVSLSVEKGVKQFPWKDKINKLCWRGRLTDGVYDGVLSTFPRGKLKSLSLDCADLDVEIESGFRDNSLMVRKGSYLTTQQQMKFKYQIVLDGITCTNPGYSWRLLSNCVVLKVNSKKKQWFYDWLVPWVHYVPIQEDLSDLIPIIHWLSEHDCEAKRIADEGRKFAKHYLNRDFQLEYFLRVLLHYQSLQTFTPSFEDAEQALFYLFSEDVADSFSQIKSRLRNFLRRTLKAEHPVFVPTHLQILFIFLFYLFSLYRLRTFKALAIQRSQRGQYQSDMNP